MEILFYILYVVQIIYPTLIVYTLYVKQKCISTITGPLPVSPVVRVRQSGRTPKARMDIFAGQMEDPAAAFSVAISGLVFADFAKRIRSE